MKRVIDGFVTYEANKWDPKDPTISWSTYDPRHSPDIWPEKVVVKQQSIEVEVPDDFDPRPDMIANLRTQEKQAMADFELKVNQIRKQISELEAIEYTPA